MRRLKSGNLLVLLFMMLCIQAKSQQVINNVTIQKAGNDLYRIQYSLNATSDFDIEKIVLKIYRKRNGNIQEIFSLPMATPVSKNQDQPYSFDWKATNGLVQTGDDLQAKIVLSLKASQAKQRLNRIPVADAGNSTEIELPLAQPVVLNGSKSHDEDGKLVFIGWEQIGGPTNLNILHRDSLIAHVEGEFKPGTYAFQLTVKDNLGSVAVSRTIVTAKEHTYWSTEPPKNNTPPKTNVFPSKQPVKNQTHLKGGPSNAAINLLLPGVGHYFVSGDHNGENRKAISFVVTAVYAGSIGSAFYFNGKSNSDYKKYNEMASYREYQKDANGTIIGVRGINEADANKYFNSAKSAHRNSLICLGVGGGVLIADLVYTFLKGSKNKREWKTENTSFKPSLIFSSDGIMTTAGVQFKF
jgi:hypothetical protein